MILPTNMVNVDAKKKHINHTFLNLWVGQKKTLKVSGCKSAKWSTTNPSIAKINKKGRLVARKIGYVRAIGTYGHKKYKCEVLVEKVPKIYPLVSKVGIGQTIKFDLINNDRLVKWSTSKKAKMTLKKNGCAKIKKTGTVTVKAKVDGTVFKKKIKIVSKWYDSICIGTIKKLPSPGKKTKWSSSNKDVISVSKKGKIKVKSPGIAVIKAKEKKKTYTFHYTVPEISISSENETITVGNEFDLNIHNYKGKVEWMNDHEDVVKLNPKGIIEGLKPGVATISAQVGEQQFQSKVVVEEADSDHSLLHNHFHINNKNTEDGMHIFVMGNSLTLHPVITTFWWGLWGMAASKAQNDYAHVISQMMSQNQNVSTDVVNYSIWERSRGNRKATYDYIDPYLTGDLDMIVIQFGENSSNDPYFQSEFEDLLDYLSAREEKAKIFVFGNFTDAPKLDAAKKIACKEYQYKYISLKSMLRVQHYRSKVNRKVYGEDGKTHIIKYGIVAGHPGDAGMKKLANYIYDANVTYS